MIPCLCLSILQRFLLYQENSYQVLKTSSIFVAMKSAWPKTWASFPKCCCFQQGSKAERASAYTADSVNDGHSGARGKEKAGLQRDTQSKPGLQGGVTSQFHLMLQLEIQHQEDNV